MENEAARASVPPNKTSYVAANAKPVINTLDLRLEHAVAQSPVANRARKPNSASDMKSCRDALNDWTISSESSKEASASVARVSRPRVGKVAPSLPILGQSAIAMEFTFRDFQLINKKTPEPRLRVYPATWVATGGIQEICLSLRLNIAREKLSNELRELVNLEKYTLELQEQQELHWKLETLREEFKILMRDMWREMKKQSIDQVESGSSGQNGHFWVKVVDRSSLELESAEFWGSIDLKAEEQKEQKEKDILRGLQKKMPENLDMWR